MPTQTTIFDAPVTRGTHRHSDRLTSIAAAQAVRPERDQERVLAALVAAGGTGTIDDVCAQVDDRDRGCLSRRITDLSTRGLVRDTGRTVVGSRGRAVTVWEVVR